MPTAYRKLSLIKIYQAFNSNIKTVFKLSYPCQLSCTKMQKWKLTVHKMNVNFQILHNFRYDVLLKYIKCIHNFYKHVSMNYSHKLHTPYIRVHVYINSLTFDVLTDGSFAMTPVPLQGASSNTRSNTILSLKE